MKKVTILDLGSDKIAAVSGTINKNGDIVSLALESLDSSAVSEGEIKDMPRAAEDIATVTERLKSDSKTKDVLVIIRNRDAGIAFSRGMVPLAKTPREVAKNDMKRCVEVAGLVRLPFDRIVIDKIVKGFYIDGEQALLRNPLGLYGKRLEVEAYIATMDRLKIENMSKCLDKAGFVLSGIYLSGPIAASVVLDKSEKENGVLLIYIGESFTEEMIFKNGALEYYNIIKKGKNSILAKDGRILSENFGILLGELRDTLKNETEKFRSVVVIGGGSLVDGVIEELETALKTPARIGTVKRPKYNLDAQNAILHTSTIGLVERIANEYKLYYSDTNLFRRTFQKVFRIYEDYF